LAFASHLYFRRHSRKKTRGGELKGKEGGAKRDYDAGGGLPCFGEHDIARFRRGRSQGSLLTEGGRKDNSQGEDGGGKGINKNILRHQADAKRMGGEAREESRIGWI